MKQGWEIKSFGEVCEIVGGSQPPKKDFIFEPKERYIRLIQVRDYKTDKYTTYIPINKAKKFCSKSDLMIGRYGPPIFGIFRGLEGAYNVALMKAVPDEKRLDKEFFYWFLKTDKLVRFVEKTSKRAAGQDGVRKERLYAYPVPLPPLPEQKRIVAILDKAFAAIAKAKANAEKNLKNAKELFESYLQGVFENKGEGWEEKRIEEVCELIMGQSPAGKTYNTDGDGIPLINGPVEFGKEPFSKTIKSKFTTDPKKYCKKGDLILCVRGSTTGRINIAGFDASIGRGVAAIRYSKNQIWLNYFIFSSRQKIYDLGTGATFPNVSGAILKNIIFPIPSSTEQQAIVKKLDALSAKTKKLEAIYQQKIDNLEELKKSVLQKAFNGEL